MSRALFGDARSLTRFTAGDIGVSGREIGWMFGQYKKQTKLWEGILTGKGGKCCLHRPTGTVTDEAQAPGVALSSDRRLLATDLFM